MKRFLVSAAAMGLVMIAPTAPASAAYWGHDDSVGDLFYIDVFNDFATVAVPAETHGDISRVSARYRWRTLILHMTFADWAMSPGEEINGSFRIASATKQWRVDFTRRPGNVFTARYQPEAGTARCTGMTKSVDVVNKKIIVKLPAACVGRAGKIKFHADLGIAGPAHPAHTYIDYGIGQVGMPYEMAESPWIRRG